jgi:ketosteroid isomerase-like protein
MNYSWEAAMKMKRCIILAVLLFFGCDKQKIAQMTPQEQESAKAEIREAVNIIFQNLEKMDVDALFQSYSDSSKFILFTTDASMVDFEGAKNHHRSWFKYLSSLNVTTVKDEFRFLPGNIVICAWLGNFKMTLKSGEQLKVDKFGVTFIFRKINNIWKVIYQHASSSPPVQVKPKKY